ncbi:MAG: hypothetical protein HQ559_12135 [Lentisphaerae bacterium]|nr:hypothetical protein [Lentisphaerota bacterium]
MPQDQLASSSFSPDMYDFIVLLHKHEVKYMVVGGEAVIFYGYARLTGDIDFFYERSPENAEKLFETLKEFWNGSVPDLEGAAELLEPGVIIQFGVPPNRIDLINQISGVEFGDAWPSRKTVTLQGPRAAEMHYLGLAALIRNKRAAARDKDLDDLQHLQDLE